MNPVTNDMNRITKWINTILKGVSNLDSNKAIEILYTCGRECAKSTDLLEGAIKIRKKFADNESIETIFQAFKKQYYNMSGFSKDGNKITLVFEECTCPMVKEGVNNPFLCNCTIGYSMQIFETLFGKPVKIKLLRSVLKGDDICEQEILIKDV
jgi:predicted hydrocarbon binding protein